MTARRPTTEQQNQRQAATDLRRRRLLILLSKYSAMALLLACLVGRRIENPRNAGLGCEAFAPAAFPLDRRGASNAIARAKATQSHAINKKSLGTGGSGLSPREAEIRRKIAALKQQGLIKKQDTSVADNDYYDDDDEDTDEEVQEAIASMVGSSAAGIAESVDYEARIRAKLGGKKAKLLGYVGSLSDDAAADETTPLPSGVEVTISESQSFSDGDDDDGDRRAPFIGSLPAKEDASIQAVAAPFSTKLGRPIFNPDLFDDDDDDSDPATSDPVSEKALIDLVEKKMLEKRARERQEEEQRIQQIARQKLAELQMERQQTQKPPSQQQSRSASAASSPSSTAEQKQLTTGVGGSWTPPDEAAEASSVEYYQPKSGSWGAFPRPKDISQAYGGGRRIGPGFSNEEERLQSEQETRERLQRYREKVGIDVPTEREHANEIDEALKIANYAMQRGRYSTGVSALEKVTKYCSTNSKVGGKVFLELAMAYEAVGRAEEAIVVYRTLSTSRIEDIKFNAKRLLYGIEAMQFMQNDVKSPEFSRRRARNTFIDTTGFGNIASHFDDVYQTAYVDLEGGFYKKLTESVVRSTREARQILLRATDAGEVQRPRVVQALRSIARSFDDALEQEIQSSEAAEPVAVINGVPILAAATAATGSLSATETIPSSSLYSSSASRVSTMSDEFVMMDPSSMLANLDGEWRLQLLADKRGDGVKYFNNSVAWQSIDTANQSFCSCGPAGFATVQRAGRIEFNEKRRILRRRAVQESGGGVLSLSPLFLGSRGGFGAAVISPQQIMSVESVLLITRGIPNRRVRQDEGEKDYFAVWRRVERGTFSR
jgi:hypothetical protein